ncbi:hypothetical protein EBS80_01560, partial [bacterium]|nr:hypothetical protein [bacterium]
MPKIRIVPKPKRMPAERTVTWRSTVAIDDPARYLAALDAIDARATTIVEQPAIATEPAPAESRVETVTEQTVPVVESPVPDEPALSSKKSGPYAMPDNSPMRRVIRAIGDQFAVPAMTLAWEGLVTMIPTAQRTEALEALDPAMARFLRAESDAQPKKVTREACYNNVICGTILPDYKMDDPALTLLVNLERTGIALRTRHEFRAFYLGISERLGHSVGAAFEAVAVDNFTRLFARLQAHIPHLPAERRIFLARTDTLLTGVDLFALGGGAVPMCKCLRIAIGTQQRLLARHQALWIFDLFTPARADDLLATLEDRRVRTRSIDRLFQRPEIVSERAHIP